MRRHTEELPQCHTCATVGSKDPHRVTCEHHIFEYAVTCTCAVKNDFPHEETCDFRGDLVMVPETPSSDTVPHNLGLQYSPTRPMYSPTRPEYEDYEEAEVPVTHPPGRQIIGPSDLLDPRRQLAGPRATHPRPPAYGRSLRWLKTRDYR
jgi:hypothetical protein